jgi:hypothetical protein
MVPIFAMFFKSYGAQNGARKNYPDLAPISDLFRGQPRSHFAQEMEQEIISTSGVFARESI